jgi:hypothetical protein
MSVRETNDYRHDQNQIAILERIDFNSLNRARLAFANDAYGPGWSATPNDLTNADGVPNRSAPRGSGKTSCEIATG